MLLDLARLLLFPALTVFAGASDLFSMTMSNRVSLALIAGFFVLAFAGGMPLHEMMLHISAGAAVLAVAFALFARGIVGGGDAKVVASTALWLGFPHLMDYLLAASLFGGALAVSLLLFRRWPLPYALIHQTWLLRLHHGETGIPYGIALAFGALMVYPETDWVKAIDLAHLTIG